MVKNRARTCLSRSPPLNGRLSSKLEQCNIQEGLFTQVWSTIFVIYSQVHELHQYAAASRVRDTATTSFYAAQKFIPYENTFGQTWKKMGWSVTCFLFWLVWHNAKCQTFRQTAGRRWLTTPYVVSNYIIIIISECLVEILFLNLFQYCNNPLAAASSVHACSS